MALVRRKAGAMRLASSIAAAPLPDRAVPNFVLEALEPRRLLSTGFGNEGWTHVDITGGAGLYGVPRAIATDPAGNIYVVGGMEGNSTDVIAAARFTADGTPDPTFGTDGSGTVTVPLGESCDADNILIQPDGKLVLTGQTPDGLVVTRLNNDGSVDTTFNGGAPVLIPYNGYSNYELTGHEAVWLTPSGGVEVVTMNGSDIVTTLLTADGQPDQSFGTDGVATTTVDPNGNELGGDNLMAAEPLRAGGVLAYVNLWSYTTSSDGTDDGPPAQQLVQIRLDDSGAVVSQQTINLALTLGNQWIYDYPIGPDVTLGNDGSAYISTGSDTGVEKLTFDGQPDTTFGNQGVAELPGPNIQVWSLTSDNKLLMQSGANDPLVWGEENGLLQLNADGSLDTTFNNGQSVAGGVYALMSLPDDSLLVAYPGWEDGSASFVLEQLNPDGTPAAGDVGIATTDAAALAVIARAENPNSALDDNSLFNYVPGTTVWDPNGDQSVLDDGGSGS
jgi:uncharacterized delta-60 repeat protein